MTMMPRHDYSSAFCCKEAHSAAEQVCWDDEACSMESVSIKPGRERLEGWKSRALRVARRAMFAAYVAAWRGRGYVCTEKAFWSKLREGVTLGDGGRPRIHGAQYKRVVVPRLDVCRDEFRNRVGGGVWNFE